MCCQSCLGGALTLVVHTTYVDTALTLLPYLVVFNVSVNSCSVQQTRSSVTIHSGSCFKAPDKFNLNNQALYVGFHAGSTQLVHHSFFFFFAEINGVLLAETNHSRMWICRPNNQNNWLKVAKKMCRATHVSVFVDSSPRVMLVTWQEVMQSIV